MKHFFCTLLVALAALTVTSTAFGQTDVAGSKDYPGISRMPGFFIADYKYSQFDSFTFWVSQGGQDKQQPVEGQMYSFRYLVKQGAAPVSAVQIVRNFQNAARSAGGQVLRDDRGATTLRIPKGSTEVWVNIDAHGFDYYMTIVERQAMKQDVTMDAAAMAQGLENAGSVAIYGIYFDTGQSEIKPESEPALTEIAKLLTQKPALKVLIVGHTDMVAGLASNMKLSQARAQAVVSALTAKHGIAAARMTPMGVGPCAPVASNKTEEGRAKNRRVELVEIATQ